MLLQKYILAALEHHPKISIENLGTFETKHQPASLNYDEQGKPVLLPPSKSVVFQNNSLALSSNVLIDEVCKDLFISNLEAQQKISQYISAIKNDLSNQKQIMLEGLGTLHPQGDDIDFVANPNATNNPDNADTNNATPTAVAAFVPMPTPPAHTETPIITDEIITNNPIADEVIVNNNDTTPDEIITNTPITDEENINNNEEENENDNDEAKPIINWGKILKAAAFIVPLLLLGFLIYSGKINIPYLSSEPTKPITKPLIDTTIIIPTDTIHPEEQPTPAQPTPTPTPTPTQTPTPAPTEPTPTQTPTTSTQNAANKNLAYHVVVGAFEETTMANNYIKQLKTKGYNAAIIGTNQYGWQQVAAASFNTMNEAKTALNTIKSVKNDAWIKH